MFAQFEVRGFRALGADPGTPQVGTEGKSATEIAALLEALRIEPTGAVGLLKPNPPTVRRGNVKRLFDRVVGASMSP